ncbi:MAG: glycosyltransferase [Trichodesmium sp. St7_bin2_1]|jgi:glycosyltransferase involved in cell wall biosynthesis|nr:glycosyltransferase [Trichodesmium sp. St7_bin2_1]
MNKSKPIAFLLPDLEWSGLGRVAVNLAKEISSRGISVDLVVGSATGVFLKEIPPQIRIVDFERQIQPRLQSALKILLPLRRYLQIEKPTALVCYLYTCNVVTLMAKMLVRSKVKLVLVEQIILYEKQEKKQQKLQERFLPILMRWLYPSADKVVACSQGLARDLEIYLGFNHGKIDVIYNPVIDEKLAEKANLFVEHPWFNKGEIPVVLGAGRLVRQKDFATLIRAFALVKKEQKVRLVILGEGQLKNQLLTLVGQLNLENDVAILDFVENPYAYMAKSAVFVLSSGWEGFGNVVAEALAAGAPVVSTNCPSGPAEILDNGKYGELVAVGNSQGMAEAILRVLSGKVRSVDSAWLEQFTLKYSAQKYLELINISV